MPKLLTDKIAEQRLALDDGTFLVLKPRRRELGRSDMPEDEYCRNVWRVDAEGNELWRLSTDYDIGEHPFMRLFFWESPILLLRWDGWIYDIDDMETGKARRYRFFK